MIRALVSVLALGALVASLMAANLRHDTALVQWDWRLIKERPKEVVIEPPSRSPIVQTITAPGKVHPVEEAKIASQVLGRVVAVHVKDGDSVQAGDVLLKVDDSDSKARLNSAESHIERYKAAITRAQSDLEKANREVVQHGRLAVKGVSTPNELADARTAAANALAALEMARQDLSESEAMKRISQQELERTLIHSPIGGVVTGLDVHVGEVVIAGTTNLPGTVLMTISDQSKMQVKADVDETDLPLVRCGQSAQVFLLADPKNPIAGTVSQVASKGTTALSGEVVSFETKVQVEPGRSPLRVGMTATVEIEVKREESALGVPVRAVVHRRRKDLPDTPALRNWLGAHGHSPGEKARDAELRYVQLVFVLDKGVARARPVETGISDEQRVEVLAGLEPTDSVIVGPFRTLDELKDGQPVQVTHAPADEQERP